VLTSNTITATQIAAGTITATQISSSYVYAGTISAGSITAGTLSASVALTAQSGTIAGFTISSSDLTNGSTIISSAGNIATAGYIHAGSTFTASGGLFSVDASGNISTSVITASGISSAGNATFSSYLYNPGHASTTSAANAYINPTSGVLAITTSSLRYKVNVEPQSIPLQSILALAPKSYIDKASADAQGGSIEGLPRILGLIAEEVAEIPVLDDLLMNKNEQGQPESVNYDRVAVALIPLLQDHEARLTALEAK
jgi:hypothetical protein